MKGGEATETPDKIGKWRDTKQMDDASDKKDAQCASRQKADVGRTREKRGCLDEGRKAEGRGRRRWQGDGESGTGWERWERAGKVERDGKGGRGWEKREGGGKLFVPIGYALEA